MAYSMVDALLAGHRYISKHEGPGPHKGTGTPQEVHAGDQPGAERGAISSPFGLVAVHGDVRKAIRDVLAQREQQHDLDLSERTLIDRLRSVWDESYREDRERFAGELGWYDEAHAYTRTVAERNGLAVPQAAGVVAALSPQTSWGRNQDMAADLMNLLSRDPVVNHPRRRDQRVRLSELDPDDASAVLRGLTHPEVRTRFGARRGELARLFDQEERNITKAIRIYRGDDPDEVLGGAKVRSFYNNVLLPQERTSWTDDTHMKTLYINDPSAGSQDKRVRDLWSKTPSSKKHGYVGPGLYPYFAQVGSDAAETIGVLPHHLQAVAWSQWRRKSADRADVRYGDADVDALVDQLEAERELF